MDVDELGAWLEAMATKALPGGLAAAAVGGAMGAALVAKSAQATLRQQPPDGRARATLRAARARARVQQQVLVELAWADERAYRAVLDRSQAASESSVPVGDLEEQQVRILATEIPIRVAEICQEVLEDVSSWKSLCWPAVRPDLEVGIELLRVGVRTGLRIADTNLKVWADSLAGSSLGQRLDALGEAKIEGGSH